MRIDTKRATHGSAARRSSATPASGGFSHIIESTARAPGMVTAAPLLAGVMPEMFESDRAGRSRAVRHGDDMLDDLESIRQALVLGTISDAELEKIAGRLDVGPQPQEPALAEILDAIRLRVAVELAKLGR